MAGPRTITFHPYRLDVDDARLWRGVDPVALKPKPFAVLSYLASRAGEFVSFDELAAAVWVDAAVSAATVRSTLREVRRVLDDGARAPRFIQTIHGRGYRFIATTVSSEQEATRAEPTAFHSPPGPLTGREDELARLREDFDAAAAGQRRLVFLHGEPGIGKTALVEEFLRGLGAHGKATCTVGRCIAGHGSNEPYLPILEALDRLCRTQNGRARQDILERCAPTWALELPSLLDREATRRLRVDAMRVDPARMLQELAQAIEAMAAEEPVVILLEDLHWSDPASLSAIDLLARRTERARLLLLGTHRPLPASAVESGNPLKRLRAELEPRGLCSTMELSPLPPHATRSYVRRRFPGIDAGEEPLADFLHARSEGSPLLFVAYTDALVQGGHLVQSDATWRIEGSLAETQIPPGLREMLDYQLDQFAPADQELLEYASVMGSEFAPYGLEDLAPPGLDLGDRLYRLARTGGVIRSAGEGFAFVHDIYREILYDRISPARRRRLHLAIGRSVEREHEPELSEVAPSLALHFEIGGDAPRAIRYLLATADVALQRSAHEQAEDLLKRARALVASLPADGDPTRTEFELVAKLGNTLSLTQGYIASEVREAYERAVALSNDIDDETPELMTALAGLHGFYELRGEHASSTEIARRQLQVADRTGEPFDRVVASLCRGTSCFSVGNYEEAARQFTVCMDTYRTEEHGPGVMDVTTDHGANCLGYGSLVFGALGRLDQARSWIARSIELSRSLGHVPSLVLSLYQGMTLEQLLRHVDRTHAFATECLELSLTHGFPYFVPATLVVSGWVDAQRGEPDKGVEQATQGLTILKEAGALLGQPLWASLLAETCAAAGRFEEGFTAVDEGLSFVESTGEVAAEPALLWVRGELLRRRWESTGTRPQDAAEAETSLRQAVVSAERRGAYTQALGPATRLATVRASEGRPDDAAQVLSALVRRIVAVPDVPLLSEAHAALEGG